MLVGVGKQMAVTITWTGHSTFLVDTGDGVLLIDPFLDECPTSSIQASDVHCDAILITHGHFDHVADTVSIAKRTQCPVLCAFEIAEWLAKQNIEINHHVHEATPQFNLVLFAFI